MPDYETLSRCFTHNPDGAGISWCENNEVKIRKGFMTFDEFNSFLVSLGKRLDLTDTSLVMHFRITTHGGTNQSNTHPFPISKKIKDLKKIQSVRKYITNLKNIPNMQNNSNCKIYERIKCSLIYFCLILLVFFYFCNIYCYIRNTICFIQGIIRHFQSIVSRRENHSRCYRE